MDGRFSLRQQSSAVTDRAEHVEDFLSDLTAETGDGARRGSSGRGGKVIEGTRFPQRTPSKGRLLIGHHGDTAAQFRQSIITSQTQRVESVQLLSSSYHREEQ